MLEGVEGLDATTKRSNHSGAELRARVRAQARLAREFGEGGLHFTDKVRLAYWNAFQHDCLNNAKAAAYSAIFAIVPAIGVIAAVMTLLPDAAPLRTQWIAVLNRALPASVASLFETYFTSSPGSRQSAGVLLGGAATSIYGAAGALATLMEGFRRAYDVSDALWGAGFRGVLRKQVQSFLLVPIALVPLAIASSLVIFGHVLLSTLMRHSPTGWDATLYWTANAIRWIAALSATAAVLACVYRFGLPLRPRWRAVLPGAAFATATWFVSTLCFGIYVTHFANYSRVYGSLGTGVVLLIWLFLTALAVLCGAELNAELARDAVLHPVTARPLPADAALHPVTARPLPADAAQDCETRVSPLGR